MPGEESPQQVRVAKMTLPSIAFLVDEQILYLADDFRRQQPDVVPGKAMVIRGGHQHIGQETEGAEIKRR